MNEKIILRDYQDNLYTEIIDNLNNESIKKLLVQAPCGAGKSIIIGKLANDLSRYGRVLILTHRIELLLQNHEWLNKAGALTSKVNTIRYDSQIIISMVETINSRIKKYGINYLGKFDYIICDEAHLDYFKKVYSQYDYKKLIGLTGTPLTNKRELKTIDGVEYARPLSMSSEYDMLVGNITEAHLISEGYLCADYNITLTLPDIDKLKISESDPDGYTKKSINEVYNNTASFEILYEAYVKYGSNKKTIIFNANSTINLAVYEYFFKLGVDCKLYDSVNDKELTRDQTVKWFEDTPGAVLINANVFTTGFNVPDVETILFNRATKSLSLYLQAIGRGARTTTNIYKDKFTVVDLGQNIVNHGTFSTVRDWQQYFKEAEWKRKIQVDLLKTWDCTYCGAINIMGEEYCSECLEQKALIIKVENGKKEKIGELQELADMPLPKAKTIINYTKANNENSSFAFKILEEKIVELFLHYKVEKSFYLKKKVEFEARIKQIYTPIYFAIIKNKEIQGPRKTLDTQIKKVHDRLNKIYNH